MSDPEPSHSILGTRPFSLSTRQPCLLGLLCTTGSRAEGSQLANTSLSGLYFSPRCLDAVFQLTNDLILFSYTKDEAAY